MTRKEISVMKNIDINQLDPEQLEEITDIRINDSLPKQERILDFIKKIRNPYCFKCNGMIIKLEFANEGMSFEEGLIQYLVHKVESTNS